MLKHLCLQEQCSHLPRVTYRRFQELSHLLCDNPMCLLMACMSHSEVVDTWPRDIKGVMALQLQLIIPVVQDSPGHKIQHLSWPPWHRKPSSTRQMVRLQCNIQAMCKRTSGCRAALLDGLDHKTGLTLEADSSKTLTNFCCCCYL